MPPPPPERHDGVRFRGGIAAVGGAEFLDNFGIGMGGLEGRLGVQLDNLIGIYAQPYLAFGAGDIGGASGGTGTAGVSALVDFTFANRVFVGVGGGAGILNNPAGPELHIRAGAYPVMGYGENGYTRKGLMVGLESRVFFLSQGGTGLTVMQLFGTIGYEAF